MGTAVRGCLAVFLCAGQWGGSLSTRAPVATLPVSRPGPMLPPRQPLLRIYDAALRCCGSCGSILRLLALDLCPLAQWRAQSCSLAE